MTHRVAVIAGDGAGPEVVAEARKAVDALGLDLAWHELSWGTAKASTSGRISVPRASSTAFRRSSTAGRAVSNPSSLDVVVASNLFGDVLTDIAAVLQGGMGMAASASVAPGSDSPPVFEPVHGSAPDIAGKGIANPMGAIWSAALMLDTLGEGDASARLMGALEDVARDGPKTGDVGGSASTSEVGDAIAERARNA